jgi:hypothetical protein
MLILRPRAIASPATGSPPAIVTLTLFSSALIRMLAMLQSGLPAIVQQTLNATPLLMTWLSTVPCSSTTARDSLSFNLLVSPKTLALDLQLRGCHFRSIWRISTRQKVQTPIPSWEASGVFAASSNPSPLEEWITLSLSGGPFDAIDPTYFVYEKNSDKAVVESNSPVSETGATYN